MIQLYHGEGKGKTTAAVGGAVRAAGAGMRVVFGQFMKGNETAELEELKKISNIDILRSKENFGFYFQMTEEQKKRLTDIHNQILDKMRQLAEQGKCDFLVMDELTYTINYNLIETETLYQFLEYNKDKIEIIITGRNPAPRLLDITDYDAEILCRKHPYERGIKARRGIEY